MKDISSYLARLNINENIKADNYSLFRFHHAHFYSVPFENFSMNENAASGSFSQIIADNIIFNKRGGKVSRHPAYGWVVSVRENSRLNADWEDIYAFHDTETFPPDISMAYFYTLHSPESLLNIHKVASLPRENDLSHRSGLYEFRA